jgi:hypothetical protein
MCVVNHTNNFRVKALCFTALDRIYSESHKLFAESRSEHWIRYNLDLFVCGISSFSPWSAAGRPVCDQRCLCCIYCMVWWFSSFFIWLAKLLPPFLQRIFMLHYRRYFWISSRFFIVHFRQLIAVKIGWIILAYIPFKSVCFHDKIRVKIKAVYSKFLLMYMQ